MDLIVFDMNGPLTEKNLAYTLSRKYRPGGMAYWDKFRGGSLSDADTVVKVGATHKGLSFELMEEEAKSIACTDGGKELVENVRNDFGILIATIDYENLARKIAGELGIQNYFGNKAVYDDGTHTGEIQVPIIDGKEKAEHAEQFKERGGFARLISIGDDMPCYELFRISDLSFAYDSKSEELMEVATHRIDCGDLPKIAEFL